MSASFEKALARHFQPSQAKSNPAAFAAAAQLLITILTDGHPQLLQVLQGSAIQQEADKVVAHATQKIAVVLEQGTDPNHIGSSVRDTAIKLMVHTLSK